MESSSYLINGGNSESISMLSLLMAEDEPSPPPPPPLKQHCSSSSSSSSPFLSPDIDYTFLLPPLPETFVFPKPEPASYDSPPTPLPELLSLESFPHAPPESQESILDEYFSHSKKAAGVAAAPRRRKFRHPAPPAASRKPTVSQKAYGLWKLLPGDHRGRRATAEILEEAHRYIRFLQAQVSALRSMPKAVSSGGGGGGGGTATGLGRLTRQQVLEVVLNSPVAQAMMAEKGWCLMASEQVALLNKIQARKRLIQHFLSSLPL